MAKVLLIDDEKSIRITLAEFLKDAQHDVITTGDPEEALRLAQNHDFDVILSDIILPRMNGIELVKKLKFLLPFSEYVVISGEPNVTTAMEALRTGVFDYLPKPVTSNKILTVVNNACQIKHLKDETKRLEEENRLYREHLEKLVEKRTRSLIKTNAALEKEIQKRKQVQDELENSRERLALVINNLPLLIGYFDQELNVLLLNDMFRNFAGKQKDLGDRKLPDILGPENWSRIADFVKKGQAGEHINISVNLVTANAEESLFRIQFLPHKDSKGNIKAYIFQGEDITEYQNLQNKYFQAQQLEALSTMAGGIGNDVNNILMIILGNLSALKQLSGQNSSAAEPLRAIEQATEKIKDLTSQLLTYSWKGAAIRKRVNISNLVRNTVVLVLKSKDIHCSLHDYEDPLDVNVDIGQMAQVIYNLVKSIAEVMHKDAILKISFDKQNVKSNSELHLLPGEYVRILFSVDRELISQEEMTRIFDPYYRWSKKHSHLDLAMAFAIVRNHDGTIMVHSAAGQTDFVIYLQLMEAKTEAETVLEKAAEPIRRRVLIMDDEKMVLDIVGKMLQQLECDMELVENGDQAVECARRRFQEGRPFDLAILDLVVPGGKGGKETIAMLRSIDPNIKVIISSGAHFDPTFVNYQDFGFNGIIRKPFRIEELKNILLTVI